MFWFLAFAEYVPFIVLLFTMWLSSRCQLNYLVCGYLYKMGEDDKSTVSRFLININATDHTFPTITVNGTTRLELMTGKSITDITIDED